MSARIVRDAIREVPGFFIPAEAFRRVKDADEHAALLLKKIFEELGELVDAVAAGTPEEIDEEACDLLELITCFASIKTGITPDRIAAQISRKQLAKGGFYGGLVWEY